MRPAPIFSLDRSRQMFDRTSRVIPGGVGSNDRALVRPHPIFLSHGKGSRIWDVDGNEYVDYLLGYGPLVLGHAHPAIVEAVTAQVAKGSMYGAGHPLEPEVAERLAEVIPCFEMVRFSASGNEAVLAAMRLARAATGRKLIVKFEGQYHGWTDQVAISYAPGEAEGGPTERPYVVSMSEGQPPGTFEDVAVLGWNDPDSVEKLFADRGDEIAGVITEPISCNFGVIEPKPGYLETLRAMCDRHGSLLIFDEVQTGFRIDLGGAQRLLGVTPDLTTLGKALSAGFPVSAVGGKREVMEQITDRSVFHAGTYNSNPLGLAAIKANIETLSKEGTYEEMERLSKRLRDGVEPLVSQLGAYIQGSRTVFGIGFGPGPISSMRDGWRNDFEKIMGLKEHLWLRGVYTKPTPRDIWYVSTEHTDDDVDLTLEVVEQAVEAFLLEEPS